jgi:hypothetical protein
MGFYRSLKTVYSCVPLSNRKWYGLVLIEFRLRGVTNSDPRHGLKDPSGASHWFLKSFYTESLILAQNERWQRGLGMQVERESIDSILRERNFRGEWRKGE